ncbi:MAG: FMN-binding protein [Sedimentisphaerales bacterium]|nr:FMN-binding protein [Sedimentisphaerales bacterium]
MIRQRSWFPIAYMFCVTAFFSSIVIGLTSLTSDRVKANETLAFERAVLSVLPDLDVEKMTRAEIHNTFTETIVEPEGASESVYTVKKDNAIVTYVLPMSGQGFWAPIKGVIGIKADRKTITGIAFYEQNETPGLGAEIAKTPFRNQFKGKVISSTDAPINIRRPGTTLGESEVHAVTGATQTSSRLEMIINTALKQWRDKDVK